MIVLTRLTGAQFALNPDLVERVDCTPDTVLTLVDGTKYLVAENLDEVVEAVLGFRARVVAGAESFDRGATSSARRTRLSAVPDDRAEPRATVPARDETGSL
ncbi:MAG: flagellar FlbD family protein [Nocardioidaceae bacterium]|nr:flagellar FlbD family protein [Nocardioidaceae bacterium]